MGFITNQWLKGRPERNRKHHPVKTNITAKVLTSQWAVDNNARVAIYATNAKADYQAFYLSVSEVDAALSSMFRAASDSTRRDLLVQEISQLEDSEIVSVLSESLKIHASSRRK